MAVPFSKPRFQFDYVLNTENAAFDGFFADPVRDIPPKGANEIDLATWNIANLGLQKRRDKDLKLIAHTRSNRCTTSARSNPRPWRCSAMGRSARSRPAGHLSMST